MAVRNFYIDARIDGRQAKLAAGPRSKNGGFDLTIYIRNKGGIEEAITILGRERDGKLTLTVQGDAIKEHGNDLVESPEHYNDSRAPSSLHITRER